MIALLHLVKGPGGRIREEATQTGGDEAATHRRFGGTLARCREVSDRSGRSRSAEGPAPMLGWSS